MTLLFNMGVPMIIPTIYFMVLALIPIILIETYYIARRLRISYRKTIVSVVVANVVSTVFGLPFTWAVLFLIQLMAGGLTNGVSEPIRKILEVTLHAPWLYPFGAEEFWVFHSAALFLLIPFFFSTWLIEYVVMKNRLAAEITDVDPEIDLASAERKISPAVRNANVISYGVIAFLLVLSLVQLTTSLR